MSITNEEYVRVFKAFCDDKRMSVLRMLKEGEECACRLLENLDICQSSLSYHMKILVESGVVESRQDGKWTYYKISKEGSRRAIDYLNFITEANEKSSDCDRCC